MYRLFIPHSFALELIESVVHDNSKVFKHHGEFTKLLAEKICPYAEQKLKKGSGDFATICRLWRVVILLMRDFHNLLPEHVLALVEISTAILDGSYPNWDKILLAEAFKDAFSEPSLIFFLANSKDNPLAALIRTLIQLMMSIAVRFPANDASSLAKAPLLKVSLLLSFEKTSAPSVSITNCIF